MPDTGLTVVELSSGGNEASDLLPVHGEHVLEAHGFSAGFWTVLDEGPVERSIALIGHRRDAPDDEGWEIHPLRCRPRAEDGRTEDGEACARRGAWVYVIGSHYGSKTGPLEPRRAFVARFDEAALDEHVTEDELELQVVRNGFRVHRVVNDALADADVQVVVPGPAVRAGFLEATVRRGEKKGKRWAGRVRADDVPLNVEGAAFRPDGSLLLALRFPVTADGHPLLVELTGIEGMFEDPAIWPAVRRVWVLRGEGLPQGGPPMGLRALSVRGEDEYDAVLGSLDATGKDSVLLEDLPQGGGVHCSHWRFSLADATESSVPAVRVRDFPHLRNVEGVASDGTRTLYVTDEDERIQLRIAREA